MTEQVIITLSRDEAIILLDMLAGFYDEESLSVKDEAERRALSQLEGALDKQLPGIFLGNHEEQIASSKQKLLENLSWQRRSRKS